MSASIHELDDDGVSLGREIRGRLRCGVQGRIEFLGNRRWLITPLRTMYKLSLLKTVGGIKDAHQVALEPTTCKSCLKHRKALTMLWHLRAMWDALFDTAVWASFFGFGSVGALAIWVNNPWTMSFGVVMLCNAVWLTIYAWWLQYGLICKYRPLEDHYENMFDFKHIDVRRSKD